MIQNAPGGGPAGLGRAVGAPGVPLGGLWELVELPEGLWEASRFFFLTLHLAHVQVDHTRTLESNNKA